ncbi:MAG: hypothetical protein FDZ72_13430 [Betaproteobacteria bacterium]|nr:MAG: hypothetical protein FDZ72_13430 [Betaproteobacteria bacterium]
MNRRVDVVYGVIAHGALILGIVLDGFRREAAGIAFYAYAIGGAILVLPAFIYFVTNPRSFFLLPGQWGGSESRQIRGRGWKYLLFVASWLFVAVWSLSWLLFAQNISRPIATYSFMCGVVVTILIAKHLFLRKEDSAF